MHIDTLNLPGKSAWEPFRLPYYSSLHHDFEQWIKQTFQQSTPSLLFVGNSVQIQPIKNPLTLTPDQAARLAGHILAAAYPAAAGAVERALEQLYPVDR